ncbi:threonylcarbamoyl-AMP synthase [Archaeoglobales archaeon]|nr:MAG: threonylcarbamoyl-AMP synthase [Archaeoglobales archaeon]
MKTKIIRRKIKIAAEIIKKGGLVAFPTETVYGLGADALNRNAVKKIFEVKRRPLDNPLIAHVSSIDGVHEIAEVNKIAERLIEAFFPGPLTLVMKKKRIVPKETTANLNTIAVRMPDHKIALKLIELSETPIAAPSANLAGKPSPTKFEHVLELKGKIDAIIVGRTNIGLESTVVDTTVYPVKILRPGAITPEMLKEFVDVEIHKGKESKPKSPGMKYKHYSPDAELYVFVGEGVKKKIKEFANSLIEKGFKVGLAVSNAREYEEFEFVEELGSDLNDVAKNLFSALINLDKQNVDYIIAEGVESEGIGITIMNRLEKASGGNVYRI